jgi:hypothetical protein
MVTKWLMRLKVEDFEHFSLYLWQNCCVEPRSAESAAAKVALAAQSAEKACVAGEQAAIGRYDLDNDMGAMRETWLSLHWPRPPLAPGQRPRSMSATWAATPRLSSRDR